MKWYSVKEYKIPAETGFLFVVIESNGNWVFDMAEYTHNFKLDAPSWYSVSGTILSNVTHFCIPDPVPM